MIPDVTYRNDNQRYFINASDLQGSRVLYTIPYIQKAKKIWHETI
jgi:hypothetical protein